MEDVVVGFEAEQGRPRTGPEPEPCTVTQAHAILRLLAPDGEVEFDPLGGRVRGADVAFTPALGHEQEGGDAEVAVVEVSHHVGVDVVSRTSGRGQSKALHEVAGLGRSGDEEKAESHQDRAHGFPPVVALVYPAVDMTFGEFSMNMSIT